MQYQEVFLIEIIWRYLIFHFMSSLVNLVGMSVFLLFLELSCWLYLVIGLELPTIQKALWLSNRLNLYIQFFRVIFKDHTSKSVKSETVWSSSLRRVCRQINLYKTEIIMVEIQMAKQCPIWLMNDPWMRTSIIEILVIKKRMSSLEGVLYMHNTLFS